MFKAICILFKNKLQLMKVLVGLFCVGTMYLSFTFFTDGLDGEKSNSLNVSEKISAEEKREDVNTVFLNLTQKQYILTRKPYSTDSDCKNLSIRLYDEDTFNLTALVSYPGSGNTWVRHLIEIATGIYTGSMYFDEELYSRGFLGERELWNSGATIVQKVHSKFNGKFNFTKSILIIREPFSAIVSFVNYMEAGHTGSASPTTFRKREWPYYILNQVYQWIELAKSWIETGNQVMVIHYEKIKENPSQQLKRICEFLNIFCWAVDSSCFRKHSEGSFHRSKTFRALPKPPYPEWVRDKVDNGIDYLNSLLRMHKHETLPFNLYDYYRKP